MFTFERSFAAGSDRVSIRLDRLVIAGWTGRNAAALQHHIAELAALGVAPPSTVPVYYRVAAARLTQADGIEVLGPDSSGEAEPVIVALADGLWLGLGSDHTDRKAEAAGIALSKQLCDKPLGRGLWRLDEVAGHWDALILRSFVAMAGRRVLYQEGRLEALRPPSDLIAGLPAAVPLSPGTILFCGTLPALGGIRPAERFEMELEDPVLRRRLTRAYDVAVLPVVA